MYDRAKHVRVMLPCLNRKTKSLWVLLLKLSAVFNSLFNLGIFGFKYSIFSAGIFLL